jgi:hypothetical protein
MMVKLLSRSEVGLPPSQAPRQEPAGVELVVVHWNGPALGALGSLAESVEAWQAIHRYHVKIKDWRDVAYTLAVCPATGGLLAGRMWHRMPAAHEPHNQGSYAVMALAGEGDPITQALQDGIRDAIRLAQRHAPIASVLPHTDVPQNDTECPGVELAGLARELTPGKGSLRPQRGTQSDSEESEGDMVDVIESEEGDAVYLHHPPWVSGPMSDPSYWVDLAESSLNPAYRGPYEWSPDRIEKHPRPEAPKSST